MFLTLVRALNEFRRLFIIHYMFKYSFRIKKKLARVSLERKKPFKGLIYAKLVIRT